VWHRGLRKTKRHAHAMRPRQRALIATFIRSATQLLSCCRSSAARAFTFREHQQARAWFGSTDLFALRSLPNGCANEKAVSAARVRDPQDPTGIRRKGNRSPRIARLHLGRLRYWTRVRVPSQLENHAQICAAGTCFGSNFLEREP
jgi:hypothetical protein